MVDDEPDARQLIRRVLADCHAEVALAASAAEALELVERFRPDVIVSDIGMPEQDGYDLIRQVRAELLGQGDPGRRPHRLRPHRGPETGLARRLPDAHRQARRSGRTDGRRREPGRPDRHERPAPRRARMTTTPLRILVVDDNADTARMLKVLLKLRGP